METNLRILTKAVTLENCEIQCVLLSTGDLVAVLNDYSKV